MKKQNLILSGLLVCIISAVAAGAPGEIALADGRVIKGRIVYAYPATVSIETAKGHTATMRVEDLAFEERVNLHPDVSKPYRIIKTLKTELKDDVRTLRKKVEATQRQAQAVLKPSQPAARSSARSDGIPASIIAAIKRNATKDFPDDYSTQNYVVGLQKKGYVAVQNYRDSRVPHDALSRIMRNAAKDFPTDWSTQKYVIDTQVEAYLRR